MAGKWPKPHPYILRQKLIFALHHYFALHFQGYKKGIDPLHEYMRKV